MKKITCPPFLSVGDKAIIISPSGNVDSLYIDTSKTILESWGLQVVIALHACQQCGRYGGTVDERVNDLQNAMDNKDIKLIMCSRGGYGVVHLLDKINFSKIKKHPKWLVGYSDITALHLAFLKHNLFSLHAPMGRHLTENNGEDVSSDYLHKLLFGSIPDYTIKSHTLNRQGKAKGHLFGGNLAVLAGLMGTKYIPKPKGGILFVEDISESPYKIDRMMWQLKLSGVLKHLSGLVIGQFTDCEEDPLMEATIYQSIRDMVAEYNYPVVFDFPVGHVVDNYPLIHGATVKLEVTQTEVKLLNID
ncbi:MAG: hypothetical protein RL662_1763 [Bacteroidota bacterium]|jgi:muramoyltetrapeptide carboxypeptidase